MQGGGFVSLLVGAIIMFFIARIVWRSVGCLVTSVFLVVVLYFVASSSGLLNNGVGGLVEKTGFVITSYSIHYTKLYDVLGFQVKAQSEKNFTDGG